MKNKVAICKIRKPNSNEVLILNGLLVDDIKNNPDYQRYKIFPAEVINRARDKRKPLYTELFEYLEPITPATLHPDLDKIKADYGVSGATFCYSIENTPTSITIVFIQAGINHMTIEMDKTDYEKYLIPRPQKYYAIYSENLSLDKSKFNQNKTESSFPVNIKKYPYIKLRPDMIHDLIDSGCIEEADTVCRPNEELYYRPYDITH